MKGILIKIHDGHQMDGEGEFLGKDIDGNPHTFWKKSGHMEVPPELALKLEREVPQRFEMVDRKLAKELLGEPVKVEVPVPAPQPVPAPVPVPVPKPVVPEKPVIPQKPVYEEITIARFNEMTKDELNDWAARRWFDVNPRNKKKDIIAKLIRQIEDKTGKRVV